MDIILHPTYFPSISHFVAMAEANTIYFEVEDHFQKQTNRNRMYIYGPNGIQLLNIPIKHSKNQPHQKYKDVRIEKAFGWQKIHFKSLEAAYRSSPFFEYFEDDLHPIFEKKYDFLMDLNFEILDILKVCLGLDFTYGKTTEYFHETTEIIDFRFLAKSKRDIAKFESYTQVFREKYGYLNNLSILDLLFNEGRYTLDYLRRQTL